MNASGAARASPMATRRRLLLRAPGPPWGAVDVVSRMSSLSDAAGVTPGPPGVNPPDGPSPPRAADARGACQDAQDPRPLGTSQPLRVHATGEEHGHRGVEGGQ